MGAFSESAIQKLIAGPETDHIFWPENVSKFGAIFWPTWACFLKPAAGRGHKKRNIFWARFLAPAGWFLGSEGGPPCPPQAAGLGELGHGQCPPFSMPGGGKRSSVLMAPNLGYRVLKGPRVPVGKYAECGIKGHCCSPACVQCHIPLVVGAIFDLAQAYTLLEC